MITEWIKLLGLDGDDPPWEGEPRAIIGKFKSEKEVYIVRVIDIFMHDKYIEVFIEEYKENADEDIEDDDQKKKPFWVYKDALSQITVIY